MSNACDHHHVSSLALRLRFWRIPVRGIFDARLNWHEEELRTFCPHARPPALSIAEPPTALRVENIFDVVGAFTHKRVKLLSQHVPFIETTIIRHELCAQTSYARLLHLWSVSELTFDIGARAMRCCPKTENTRAMALAVMTKTTMSWSVKHRLNNIAPWNSFLLLERTMHFPMALARFGSFPRDRNIFRQCCGATNGTVAWFWELFRRGN